LRSADTGGFRLDPGALLLVAAAATFIAIGVLPHLGLYRPVTVLSQSMRPTFAAGDLLIVTPEPLERVRVGQVLTYAVPVGNHYVETHRVVELVHRGAHPVIRTRGDANSAVDPWTARLGGTHAWKLRLVVPYAGWVVIALRSRAVHVLALLVAPLLLSFLGLRRIWRPVAATRV
jgi:signal peptidase